MDNYIKLKENEIQNMKSLWEHVVELSNTVALKEETLADIKAKVSSRIAQCEISIDQYKWDNL